MGDGGADNILAAMVAATAMGRVAKERGEEERSVVMVKISSRWERGEERSVVVMVGAVYGDSSWSSSSNQTCWFLIIVGVVRMEGNDGKIG